MFLRKQKIRQSVLLCVLLFTVATIPMHRCPCECLVLKSYACKTDSCCSQLNDLSVPHFCVESEVTEQKPHKKPTCPHCISKRLGYFSSPRTDGQKTISSPAWTDGFHKLIVCNATASLTFSFALRHSPPTASLFHLRI